MQAQEGTPTVREQRQVPEAISQTAEPNQHPNTESAYSIEEEALVTERLKNLGYL